MSGVPQQAPQKTFYLETFGCQMNVHDSEKVVGTLVQQGYRQVETVEQADLILYNTCSIRDKAEQKVFHRLADYKKLYAQGKRFGVLGCVAQQEGEKIFERAPHVSLVCGSASYRNLPQMLVQLEAASHSSRTERGLNGAPGGGSGAPREIPRAVGESTAFRDDALFVVPAGKTRDSRLATQDLIRTRDSGLATRDSGLVRITGLDDRQTDKCFETEFTARNNPHRGYITIIEGCDKFCAYCVVPFTRGKERSRTSESVLAEARQMADLGYSEIQLLGQNVNSYKDPEGKRSFAELLAAVGEVPGIKRVRFTTSHPRDFGRDIVDAIDAVPTLCDHVHLPVQSGSTRVLDAMQRLYTRDEYLERIAWLRAAKREISITTDVIVGFPGETEADFAETLTLLDEVGYDGIFSFKYSPRPNTPAIGLEDAVPDQEKAHRLDVLMQKQKQIQIEKNRKHLGSIFEVMVEAYNPAHAQWVGRTSQNKILNFTAAGGVGPKVGAYAQVLVTAAFPNSLAGELVV
jgi:tRNA-2-methylthio-N6-dimethylallyladenosine synthase